MADAEVRDILEKLWKEMKDFGDSSLQLPSKSILVDVTNTFEKVLKEDNRIKDFQHLQEVKTYYRLEVCLKLIRIFAEHIFECLHFLKSHVTGKDNVDAIQRVEQVLRHPVAILEKATRRVNDIGSLLMKTITLENQPEDRFMQLFSFEFNMVVVDLEVCSSRLMRAKDNLEGIASKKEFQKWKMATLASTGFGALFLSSVTIPLFAAVGVAAAVFGVMTYVTSKLRSDIPFDEFADYLCGILESDKIKLDMAMRDLRKQCAFYDSAKQIADLNEYNRLLKEKLAELECEKIVRSFDNVGK